MENMETVMQLAAVIVACLLFVARIVLAWYGKTSVVAKYDHYKPLALMAAKWVENKIPDDYGGDSKDGKLQKSLHKLDVFLQKFCEMYLQFEGQKPSEDLKAEAMKWSTELADRLTFVKEMAEEKAADAAAASTA